jgi:uroporphyrinogen decarboxylase
MNQRALVLDALAHRETGRTPYSIVLAGSGFDKYADQLLEDYPNPLAISDWQEGRVTKQQALAFSMGCSLVYVQPPWWNWTNLTDDFLKSEDPPNRLPDTRGFGNYEAFFEQLHHIRACYDVYIVATIWGSHWEKAYFARGIENFLADLAGAPEWAQSLLDMIIRKNLVMLENILTAPELDAVLLGSDWGTQRDLIMSPQCFRTMIKPGEKQEYDLIKRYGKQVFIHSCGDNRRIMPDLVELGVDCLNPVQPECMPLDTLKREYGRFIAYYGGISTQRTLPYGTPEAVARETEETIDLLGRNGGYITAPSQEIQDDVPYANLRALIDTARRHAR